MKSTVAAVIALSVCAAVMPARANVIFTLTFGPGTSSFSGTAYSASTFSFTAPAIPSYFSGASGYSLGTEDGTEGYAADFTGAALNGLPITGLTVTFAVFGGVNYADLSYYTNAVLSDGALGGFDNFEVPLGLSSNLAPGSYNAVFGVDRFEADGCEGPGSQGCVFIPGAESTGSLTIADSTPEPSSAFIAMAGLVALALLRKRSARRTKPSRPPVGATRFFCRLTGG